MCIDQGRDLSFSRAPGGFPTRQRHGPVHDMRSRNFVCLCVCNDRPLVLQMENQRLSNQELPTETDSELPHPPTFCLRANDADL